MTNGGDFKDCPCAPIFRCPTCGPYGYESPMPDCPCMPQPSCPNCIIGKILSKYHQKSASIALKDSKLNNKLSAESLLEKKLFEQAEKYANDAAAEEKLAREAAV